MSNVVLISIHPEHATNILSGKKTFEYRKVVPKNDISHLVLYCTGPIKKIFAVVEVLGCVTGSPYKVWNETSFGSGISRHFFRQYFSGQRIANAFQLGRVYQVSKPIDLTALSRKQLAPQSFCYLDDVDVKMIAKLQSARPAVSSNMLFVGGIHGVGKTTICKKSFSPTGYQCVTASSLIAADRRRAITDKRVDDVSNNQAALLRQLTAERTKYCRLLLDGHFTLINKLGEIEPIDVDVFQAINPDLLVLIKGSPAEIAKRLKQRDGKAWKLPLIKKFQTSEEEHANLVSSHLGIPLRIFDNDVGYAVIAKTISKELMNG